MKILLFLALLSQNVFADSTRIVALSSDKAVYAAGENAVLRAKFFTRPNNPNYDFDIVGILNGSPLPVTRITDFEMFSSAKNLVAGNYAWTVSVVVQDARYARDLKTSIAYFESEIERLTQEIAQETDPDRLENLNRQKAKNESLKAASVSELNQIRTPVLAPQTITFIVQ